jgi:hypothetical protein
MDNEDYILGDYLTNAHYDIEDMPASDIFDGCEEEPLPTTDAGNVALLMISHVNELHSVPIHVVMNQIGNLCNIYNNCITGTNPQQKWINILLQNKFVSLILLFVQWALYFLGFYSKATNDMGAILGDAPLFT